MTWLLLGFARSAVAVPACSWGCRPGGLRLLRPPPCALPGSGLRAPGFAPALASAIPVRAALSPAAPPDPAASPSPAARRHKNPSRHHWGQLRRAASTARCNLAPRPPLPPVFVPSARSAPSAISPSAEQRAEPPTTLPSVPPRHPTPSTTPLLRVTERSHPSARFAPSPPWRLPPLVVIHQPPRSATGRPAAPIPLRPPVRRRDRIPGTAFVKPVDNVVIPASDHLRPPFIPHARIYPSPTRPRSVFPV